MSDADAAGERSAPTGHWCLRFEGFDADDEGRREALCTLANGYWAVRGAAPESVADGVHYPGSYVAGVYNRLSDEVLSRTVTNESLVNLPNPLLVQFRVEDGDWFDVASTELLDHVVALDTHRAVLHRNLRFRDSLGRVTSVDQRRLVHLGDRHVAALATTFTAENWSGSLLVRSGIDGRVRNENVERYRSLSARHLVPLHEDEVDRETVVLQAETNQSHVRVALAARTRVRRDGEAVATSRRLVQEPGFVAQEFALDLMAGVAQRVEKAVTLYTSRDHAITEPAIDAVRSVTAVDDFDRLEHTHAVNWAHVWRRGDIEIEIDDGQDYPPPEIALRVNLFHLLQTVTKNTADLDVGVPARGLHGEAYRGHIFWDELFVFPYLNLRFPKLTRGLLLYRYRRLPEARRAAAAAGLRGAMFPWQSGSNGQEETQTWHLNPISGRWLPDGSHLQRHVNIAIAYNVWQYYDATRNDEFLSFYGAELMFEIARFWASVAVRDPGDGRYDIEGVVGPDEYHEAYPGADRPGLRNNAYTNLMAAWVLARALEVGAELLTEHRCQELHEKLGIDEAEIAQWDEISRRLRVPFHDGVISQFEGYGDLAELDWDAYRARYGDIRRLDRVLEAEGDSTNNYKLSKQADVLMVLYLLSVAELSALLARLGYDVDDEQVAATVDYYLARTSHGSSLSGVVHSWLMVRAGREPSWPLFEAALESDLEGGDGGTVREGIHLGAMAGTIDLVQSGYGGVLPRDGVLWIEPALPPQITHLSFNVGYRGSSVRVHIERDTCTVQAHPNAGPISVGLDGEIVALAPNEARSLVIARR